MPGANHRACPQDTAVTIDAGNLAPVDGGTFADTGASTDVGLSFDAGGIVDTGPEIVTGPWEVARRQAMVSSPRAFHVDDDGVLDVVIGRGVEFDSVGGVDAFSGADGELLWSVDGDQEMVGTASPAELDGDEGQELVIGGRDGELHALDVETEITFGVGRLMVRTVRTPAGSTFTPAKVSVISTMISPMRFCAPTVAIPPLTLFNHARQVI